MPLIKIDVKVLKVVISNNFICHLDINSKFDIEQYDFYNWLIKNDDNFKKYSDRFNTWTELTEFLKNSDFNFIAYTENYINSEFSDLDISEFCYK
jgi:hypothetical protein